jgi:hypothetical protein
MPSKVATRSSLEQVAIIDAMLARPQGASVAELVERLKCCEKTVKRHVSWMRKRFELRICIVGWDRGPDRRWVYPNGQASIFTREAARRLS